MATGDVYPAGEPFRSAMTGWQCPICGRCYAPFVSECPVCNGTREESCPACGGRRSDQGGSGCGTWHYGTYCQTTISADGVVGTTTNEVPILTDAERFDQTIRHMRHQLETFKP